MLFPCGVSSSCSVHSCFYRNATNTAHLRVIGLHICTASVVDRGEGLLDSGSPLVELHGLDH
jgi:hypothetical protein